MRAASVCTLLGLTLISGALLAATTGVTSAIPSRIEARFEALDANGDGEIASSEAKESAGLAQHFSELDRDGDGALSWPEFRGHGMPGEIPKLSDAGPTSDAS